MMNLSEETLATIVTRNHLAAKILEKHNLDFCCKGKRKLWQACNEKGVMLEAVIQELNQAETNKNAVSIDFGLMNADNLIHYILSNHHSFVKQSMPGILTRLEKVISKHGKNYPYMISVYEKFSLINEELTSHLFKEEEMLFPRLKEFEYLFTNQINITFPDSFIKDLLTDMEAEHANVGILLSEIFELTNNYTIPKDACTTFRGVIEELKYFEQDLHKHIHLENNLLFPRIKNMVFN